MATSLNMMRKLLILTACVVFGWAHAASLANARRSDISLDRFNYTLEGDLVRAIDDYRVAVNQTAIEPSQERQVLAEKDRLQQLLKSRGYYHAQIASRFDAQKNKPRYSIALGRRYRIAKLEVQGDYNLPDEQWQSIDIGDWLSASEVLAQQSKLKKTIEQQSCFYSLSVTHEVRLEQAQHEAELTYRVNARQPASFNGPTFVGIEGIKQSFLARVTGIRSGDCYQRELIDNAVIALFDTGLFSQVRPKVQIDADLRVNVEFSVQKRKKRTLSASLGFKSEQGFGAKAGWQHRDLFGSAQSLSLQTQVQAFEQEASAELVIPSFLDRRNRLSWLNRVQRSTLDFEAINWSSTATMERKASINDYFEFGIGYSQINENPDDQWQRFQQIRVPLQYKFDSVRNPLNPRQGWRLKTSVEPVFDIQDDLTPFVKTGLGVQLFMAGDEQVTLASRLRWDSLWYGDELGSNLDNIPESELYSAGGSSSVRGFGYQSIKLTDSDTGGTQRWLFINEMRLRLNESWGLVGFWDMGRIGQNLQAEQANAWHTGYGLGVRYFTRFAPIRLDVAFPKDARPQDANFLIYLSLGQAF